MKRLWKYLALKNGNKVIFMSKIVSLCLFFTSFLPLWISVLFIDIKSCIENQEHLWTEKISISIIVVTSAICLIVLTIYFKRNRENEGTELVIINAYENKTISAEYLLSYILPLFAFDFTLWSQVVLFLIFFITLGFLFIKHNHFSVNILLELMNYKTYSCMVENEDNVSFECKVLSHRELNLHRGDQIYLKSINNEIKLDIER